MSNGNGDLDRARASGREPGFKTGPGWGELHERKDRIQKVGPRKFEPRGLGETGSRTARPGELQEPMGRRRRPLLGLVHLPLHLPPPTHQQGTGSADLAPRPCGSDSPPAPYFGLVHLARHLLPPRLNCSRPAPPCIPGLPFGCTVAACSPNRPLDGLPLPSKIGFQRS